MKPPHPNLGNDSAHFHLRSSKGGPVPALASRPPPVPRTSEGRKHLLGSAQRVIGGEQSTTHSPRNLWDPRPKHNQLWRRDQASSPYPGGPSPWGGGQRLTPAPGTLSGGHSALDPVLSRLPWDPGDPSPSAWPRSPLSAGRLLCDARRRGSARTSMPSARTLIPNVRRLSPEMWARPLAHEAPSANPPPPSTGKFTPPPSPGVQGQSRQPFGSPRQGLTCRQRNSHRRPSEAWQRYRFWAWAPGR